MREHGKALVADCVKQIKAGKQQTGLERLGKKAKTQLAAADTLIQEGTRAVQCGKKQRVEAQQLIQQGEQQCQERVRFRPIDR